MSASQAVATTQQGNTQKARQTSSEIQRQAVPFPLPCVSTDVRRRAFTDAMNQHYLVLLSLRRKFLPEFLGSVMIADELMALVAYFLTAFGSSLKCHCGDLTVPVFEFEMRAIRMPSYFIFEFDNDNFLYTPLLEEPVICIHFFFCIISKPSAIVRKIQIQTQKKT